jgi:GxxExxY protein
MEHKDTKTQRAALSAKTQSAIPQEEYDRLQQLSNTVIGAAIEVHRELGPGLLESVYEECLRVELESIGLSVKTQVDFPLIYKGKETGKDFRIDMLIEDVLIVELKAVKELDDVHRSQAINYAKVAGFSVALLINFGETSLRFERFATGDYKQY